MSYVADGWKTADVDDIRGSGYLRPHSAPPTPRQVYIPPPVEVYGSQHTGCRLDKSCFHQDNECEGDIRLPSIAPGEKVTAGHSPSHSRGRKRKREHKEHEETSTIQWLESLPESIHDFDMSQPVAKRQRSHSRASVTTTTSEGGAESTVSRETKYSIYQDPRYPALLESQGSYMGESPSGLLSKELSDCQTLFTNPVVLPPEPLLDSGCFQRFLKTLENRSELRVCIDLHPRLVPSAELLSLQQDGQFSDIVDGYNDRWTKAVVFYKKLPQPDRTVAFRESALTDEQRCKLNMVPEINSIFSIREGMCFPFLTCEVKCGKQALDIADRPNANSMTIATRAKVELYRRAGRVADIHRRVTGFSISHDDKCVRIYAHYAEIHGDKTQYYRHLLRSFDCRDKDGQDRWTTYKFVVNVYTKFAPAHLTAIRNVIDELPSVMARSVDSTATENVAPEDSESQEIVGTPSSSQQDDSFIRPETLRGRTTVKQQLQQMQEDARVREQRQIEVLEKQRQESQTHISRLESLYKQQIGQQEQRYKEQEQHYKEQEQRYKEQIDLLKSLLPGG